MKDKNKTISLKENKINMLIQKVGNEIKFAEKKGDLEAARKFKMKLKLDLETAGYNWQKDPYAVELISEAAKIKNKEKMSKNIKKTEKTIVERKISILTKKIEEATGKKVVFKESKKVDVKKVKTLIALIEKYTGKKVSLKEFEGDENKQDDDSGKTLDITTMDDRNGISGVTWRYVNYVLEKPEFEAPKGSNWNDKYDIDLKKFYNYCIQYAAKRLDQTGNKDFNQIASELKKFFDKRIAEGYTKISMIA